MVVTTCETPRCERRELTKGENNAWVREVVVPVSNTEDRCRSKSCLHFLARLVMILNQTCTSQVILENTLQDLKVRLLPSLEVEIPKTVTRHAGWKKQSEVRALSSPPSCLVLCQRPRPGFRHRHTGSGIWLNSRPYRQYLGCLQVRCYLSWPWLH